MLTHQLKRILFIIAFTLFLTFFLLRLGNISDYIGIFLGILQPFLIGCFAAFLINIPMRWIEKLLFYRVSPQAKIYRFKRVIGLLLTLAVVAIFIVSIFKLIIPTVASTIGNIINAIPGALDELNLWLLSHEIDTNELTQQLTKKIPSIKNLSLDNISWEQIASISSDYITQILSTTTNIVSLIFFFLADVIIAFCFSLYLLFSKETLSRHLKKLLYAFLPEKLCDRLIQIGQLSVDTFCDFFSGQFTEACILGFLFFIILTLMKMPYTVLISVLITITAMIPVFGAFIGCAVGALLILIADPLKAVIFTITFLIVQQLEGNLIYPHVVGGKVGLPSLWVLVAVTVGGGLMGVLGMLLFIPAFSVAYKLLRERAIQRLSIRQVSNEKWIVTSEQKPLRLHLIFSKIFFYGRNFKTYLADILLKYKKK